MDYKITFAGVPFINNTARVFRFDIQGRHELEVGEEQNQSPRKHQPLTDLIEELDRMLPFNYLNDISYQGVYPGRNLGAISCKSETGNPGPKIGIGEWYYPNTACKWSVYRGLANSVMVKQMLAQTQGQYPRSFVMLSSPVGAGNPQGTPDNYRLETQMYMLPPRPLAEHGGQYNGLYLVTLVDERFYFQNTPVSLHVQRGTTWQNLIDQIKTALSINVNPIIPTDPVYGTPELDSQLWTNFESASILFDAIAANIGKVVVRKLDGVYWLLTPEECSQKVIQNRTLTNSIRTAGGNLFYDGTKALKVGDLSNAKNSIVPTKIHVTFPFYVQEDDPVPHFLNSRYQNQRRSVWYEESYGSVYSIAVPITSGGPFISGMHGTGEKTIQDTAKALISGEIQATPVSGQLVHPINESGLTALAMKLAQDQYGFALAGPHDEVFPGTLKWEPDGVHDIVWTYSEKQKQATCRIARDSWTQSISEFQHSTPNISGFTANPRGIGGPSVAQTIRDSVGFSGTVIAPKLTVILFSGQMVAGLSTIDNLPTDNRWRARIENEVVLFEGTSGGYDITTSGSIISGTDYSLVTSGAVSSGMGMSGQYVNVSGTGISGYAVQIAYRGIDGTVELSHNNETDVTQINPDVTYGVNLTTYGHNQFIFPSEWTSGGIQGVKVQPQTQFVLCLDGNGVDISGVNYFSGLLQLYNPAKPDSWVSGNYVWLVGGTISEFQAGTRYGAIFTGYSPSRSGSAIPAPVYIPVGGAGGGISLKDSYGKSGYLVGLSGRNVVSGKIFTQLQATLTSGGTAATFHLVDYFPTQNRWIGILDNNPSQSGNEIILFEGTSGGFGSPSAGFGVDIVQRGLEGTGTYEWLSGTTVVCERMPHVVSGASIITYEQGQFIYPQEVGTAKGVNIPTQTQTVIALTGSGTVIEGLLHYSGRITSYDSTQGSGPYIPNDFVWIVDRYGGFVHQSGPHPGYIQSGQWVSDIKSGQRYHAQLVGYSASRSGTISTAPIYLTNEIEKSFLAQLTYKNYGFNTSVQYSWIRVNNTKISQALTYFSGLPLESGGPDYFPAYQTKGVDYPVFPIVPTYATSGLLASGPLSGGLILSGATYSGTAYSGMSFSGSYFSGSLVSGGGPQPLSVVRLRKGDGDFVVFDDEPWVDIFRRTGDVDEFGDVANYRIRNQFTKAWQNGITVRIIDAD